MIASWWVNQSSAIPNGSRIRFSSVRAPRIDIQAGQRGSTHSCKRSGGKLAGWLVGADDEPLTAGGGKKTRGTVGGGPRPGHKAAGVLRGTRVGGSRRGGS